jgi:plasmid stability protein
MGDLLIRNIPEKLKQELEQAAKRDGQSLSAKSINLLRKSLAEDAGTARDKPFVSAWAALRGPFVEHDALDDDYAKIMDEIEADRKRDFGRPLPDFE